MTVYDELEKDIEALDKNLYVDDIGEAFIDLLYYGDDTEDLLNEIEDILHNYDKNNFLFNVKIGKDDQTEEYLLLSYKCKIGEDLETEKDLYERSLDDEDDRYEERYFARQEGL